MTRLTSAALVAAILTLSAGCGGGAKNSDPKPAPGSIPDPHIKRAGDGGGAAAPSKKPEATSLKGD